MASRWTREETFQLIDFFHDFQLLWDTNLPEYRDRAKKQNSLILLANSLGKPTEDVCKKIHNLRCQLQAEVRRIKIKQLEGINYKSSWEYFDRLRFLLRDDKHSTKPPKAKKSSIGGNASKALMITCKPDIANAVQVDGQQDQKLNLKRIMFHQGADDDIKQEEQEERDEFSIFGEYVASELRNMDSPILRKKLKLKIQKALLEINEEHVLECEAQPATNKAVTTATTFGSTPFQVISATQARQLQQQHLQQQLQQQQLQQQQVNNLAKVEYCQL